MAEHSLIQDYRDVLRAELPAHLADEVADGLAETNEKYLQEGLSTQEAAHAAIAEFGDPALVVLAFSRASPARRVARRLIVTGPAVGLCWGAVLITGRAWDWPVPASARLLFGMTLAVLVGLLVTAALARRYRFARRAGIAACGGLAFLDASAIAAVMVIAPSGRWLVILASCASAARLIFIARAVRPLRTC